MTLKHLNIKKAFAENFSIKIFIRIFILIALVSFVFIVGFINYQYRIMSDSILKEGMSLAKIFAHSSRLGVFSENPEFLNDPVNGLMQREEILSVYVYSLDGRILSSKGRLDGTSMGLEEKKKVIKNKKPIYLKGADSYKFLAPVLADVKSFKEESLFLDESFSRENQVIGFVRIDMSKKHLNKFFMNLLIYGIIMGAVLLSVGSILAYFLTKRLAKPIIQLTNEIQAFSKGELITQASVDTNDEIGKLTSAFNQMIESLKEKETEKQKLAEQLGHAQRLEAIGTFAGGIAHDFNNFLTIIQNNTELAQIKAPEYLKEYLKRSLEAVNRGAELVKQLLYFTLESPKNAKPVDIGILVNETTSLLKESTDSQIKVHVDIEEGLWKINADAGQIQQVIMNLFINACDTINACLKESIDKTETDKSYNISISLKNVILAEGIIENGRQSKKGAFVLLSMRDDGCGMDEETLLRIFELFFTTKNSLQRTGLGLSAVHGIVKRHGGWIDVDSKVGEGTVFNVYFPRHTGEQVEIKTEEKICEHLGGNETILLVDDEEHIISATKERLEELGYTVIIAREGETALNILQKKRKKIDLIVLDHIMPGVSGIEVLQRLRQMNIKTKVLMCSGKDLSPYAHVCEGSDFISKPYSLDAFVDKVRALLGYEWKYSLKSHINQVKLYYLRKETVPYDGETIDSPTVYKLFQHIANEPRETFISLYLDSQNKIIAYEDMTSGTTDETNVYPKEIVRSALLTNATSIILIHNHPSGNLKPSSKDMALTASIQETCKTLDIKVHDHIIISGKGYYSFLETGLL